jgi:hypothetical protein
MNYDKFRPKIHILKVQDSSFLLRETAFDLLSGISLKNKEKFRKEMIFFQQNRPKQQN